MLPISTRIHGWLDYSAATLLILSPWALHVPLRSAAGMVPVITGICILLYSFCTHYEAGCIKIIPMRTHRMLDSIAGIFLVASPFLFGFYTRLYAPHLWFGIGWIILALITTSRPYVYRQMRREKQRYLQYIRQQYH